MITVVIAVLHFLLCMAGCVFLYLFYHAYAGVILLAVVGSMPLYYFISCYFVGKYTQIFAGIKQESVAKQHEIHIQLQVKNRTFFSSDRVELKVCVENAFYKNLERMTVTVPSTARETREVEFVVTSKYSGLITVRVESARVLGLTRMFTKKIALENCSADVIVMPDDTQVELHLEGISEGEGEQQEVQYKKGSDVSEISEIREYVPGDKLQMVHWKLSTKMDKMMVKEYSMPYTNELLLIPEMYYDEGHPEYLDEVIDTLYSAANQMLHERRVFYIGWLQPGSMEITMGRIESELDITKSISQLFYQELWKNKNDARDFLEHIGRYDGKSILYVGKAVVECLS